MHLQPFVAGDDFSQLHPLNPLSISLATTSANFTNVLTHCSVKNPRNPETKQGERREKREIALAEKPWGVEALNSIIKCVLSVEVHLASWVLARRKLTVNFMGVPAKLVGILHEFRAGLRHGPR